MERTFYVLIYKHTNGEQSEYIESEPFMATYEQVLELMQCEHANGFREF